MRGLCNVWPLVPLPAAHVRRVWGEGHKGIRQVKPAPQTDQQLVSLGRPHIMAWAKKSQEIHLDSASSLLAEIQHNKAKKRSICTRIDQQLSAMEQPPVGQRTQEEQ